MLMADRLLDLKGVAEFAGISYGSARTYRDRSTKNRRMGSPKPGDLPPEDDRFGNTPVWRESTLQRWIECSPRRAQVEGAGRG